jgi:hypothetical protein
VTLWLLAVSYFFSGVLEGIDTAKDEWKGPSPQYDRNVLLGRVGQGLEMARDEWKGPPKLSWGSSLLLPAIVSPQDDVAILDGWDVGGTEGCRVEKY